MTILDRPNARSLGDMDEITSFQQIQKKTFKKNLFLIVKEACIARVGVCVPYGIWPRCLSSPSLILIITYNDELPNLCNE